MKTTDLIPLILFELEKSDKYGFELTKNIETKSNGKILIKQPTLYTLLKKLEKSKFISSYWQDSEIGGKRHYYKLTDNGRSQLSTLPSYEVLIKKAINEDSLDSDLDTNTVMSFSAPEDKPLSIMDELLNQNIGAKETILPSEEVFSEDSLDTATELDLNLSNTNVLKDEKQSQDETFATNKQVSTFTEKITNSPTPTPVVNEQKWSNISELDYTIQNQDTEIKHIDFVDFKNSKEYKYAAKVVRANLFRVLATSFTLLFILLISEICVLKSSSSSLFYVFFIVGILGVLFYPTLYLIKTKNLRFKYQQNTYQPKYKQRLIIGSAFILAVAILSIIFSVNMGKNTLSSILSLSNFASFYAPIFITSIYFIDIFYSFLFTKKINRS